VMEDKSVGSLKPVKTNTHESKRTDFGF